MYVYRSDAAGWSNDRFWNYRNYRFWLQNDRKRIWNQQPMIAETTSNRSLRRTIDVFTTMMNEVYHWTSLFAMTCFLAMPCDLHDMGIWPTRLYKGVLLRDVQKKLSPSREKLVGRVRASINESLAFIRTGFRVGFSKCEREIYPLGGLINVT